MTYFNNYIRKSSNDISSTFSLPSIVLTHMFCEASILKLEADFAHARVDNM